MDKDQLKSKILEANNAYRAGSTLMADDEYDALVEQFKTLFPDEYDSFRDSLNEGSIESGEKVKHKYIMGSLDKIKNSDTIALEKFLKEHVKTKLNISAKVDGISSVAHYVDGKLVALASRGKGYEGTDFTDKAPYIKGLMQTISSKEDLYIRGELVILNTETIDTETNFRNICAGYMNSKYWKKEDIAKISFVPYTVLGPKYMKNEQFKLLKDLGFNVAWNESIDPKTQDLADVLTQKAKLVHSYSCDGLVLTDSNAYNEVESYRPKNAMAFKINELSAVSKVVDVDWSSVSKDGFIVPVFILEPVELGGAVISRASASNLDVISKLGARYGSIVRVSKRNDIIPYVDEVIDNSNSSEIELPAECPCCGSKLVRDGVNLRCMNKNCKDQVLTQIEMFIKKLGVKCCSFATLDNFGIASFDGLVSFKPDKKYKMQTKLYDELCTKVFTKTRQELLAATNFKDLAEKTINKIVDAYGFEKIELAISAKCKPIDFFKTLPDGIGEITLNKFMECVQNNLEIVNKFINDSRYNCSRIDLDDSRMKNGMSICFTGSLNTMSRSEAAKKAELAGFEVKNGVSKGLTYLCTNDTESGTSKNEKAKKLGTKIIDEEEFISLVSNSDSILEI